MTDLDRIFADIAVLEAVINDAREAGDEEAAEKAMRLLGRLWQRIAETPKLLRQLTEPLSEAGMAAAIRPENGGGKGRSKSGCDGLAGARP